MPELATQRIQQLSQTDAFQYLKELQRGIEKESLRTDTSGLLAQTDHPQSLGSALTHPRITTDFSEALLELITPVFPTIDGALASLDEVHTYVYSQLDNELLWTASMPCQLPADEQIPVARYGSSNVAEMKTTYRIGLGNRYGRAMQTISGIHYNFSLPEALWPHLQQQSTAELQALSLQDYKTESYFHLIRNFRRISWLLPYLYGASPAVSKCFLQGQQHNLQALDESTLYLPHATALRMGDFGYQSNAQNGLAICYNTIANYIETLKQAIVTEHPDYQKIGIKKDGQYQQLSTALLQIENEFYSTIRPKRVTKSGEIPLGALQQRGVEYIEVRSIDVNPYLPLGIDKDQIRFIDCLLLFCLFDDSPKCDADDRARIDANFKAVVNHGRQPGLQLQQRSGNIAMTDWAEELLQGMTAMAKHLDQLHGGDNYQRVCQQQLEKLHNPALTPSAKILADMQQNQQSYFEFALAQSQQHYANFTQAAVSRELMDAFQSAAKESNQRRQAIESECNIDFDQYLANFYQQYQQL
ncbi:glutamate--cysteine ligase [Dasania sp. GY-MA-18]|uniref:Glutamate--cysteine ligase n=1 Tax=Dasania phycosphaerae TaxID=2950436 RepID=A0A9J6RJX1_9GAMM|nr:MULTISPECIES: glutamate--cysteine ligase [Dasania]MCR8922229.1 glutamate--cysteine ligase [Dasania sp. GY-MA-18]MCZ0864657.1 glutamate--cysteine ligase [Dasania phycosphaerae]MCZ0868385.1 glutamate--cysteine ligase [Dasania phycosphaerae]